MVDYSSIQKEETLKARIYHDYFEKFKYGYEPNIDNIDFVITEPISDQDSLFQHKHFLWAEAKRGIEETATMITQLILTCHKTYVKGDHTPPPYIGCFDSEKIAFVPFRDILPIFKESDFNWNITPSNHDDPDFKKARSKILRLIAKNLLEFLFEKEKRELLDFIKKSLTSVDPSVKVYITADNFVHIYNNWVKEIKPTIAISKQEWIDFRNEGILDCDFYRADLMSKDGCTITNKLKIVLDHDKYKFQLNLKGRLFSSDIDFTDGGAIYRKFWNKYQRPPLEEYQAHIIDRRDLLVPQNIREIKGSFFTPQIWVKKSQDYLTKVFGKKWQDEYFIWDCAAGTGNLLADLKNEYNIWASTIDDPDVDSMKALLNDVEGNDSIKSDRIFNLLEDHIFQFDFLNDKFDKLPDGLKEIINDPKKRKKLIIYINPPYAESASSHRTSGKKTVEQSKVHDKYAVYLRHAQKELFAQFLARIYFEIPDCKIAEFSKLKALQSPRFSDFRLFFKAKLEKCFVVHANTFDNVKGKFPIGFKIWDTGNKLPFSYVNADVLEDDGSFSFTKKFCAYNDEKLINDWCDTFKEPFSVKNSIATLVGVANDFQQQNVVFFDKPYKKVIASNHNIQVTKKNLIESCIYFSVRKCIAADWLNDRDQFLYPNNGWKRDSKFQNDCLVFSLFNNAITSSNCVNHWIPFTAKEVKAKDSFKSTFMSDFIKDRTFGRVATKVVNAGKDLWKYYHKTIRNNRIAPVNASLYDIREYYQGRNKNGKMNNKSDDNTYNVLIKTLRDNLRHLADDIAKKVYQYGFLME